MNGLREECGVFGLWSPHRFEVARTVYYGLFSLQHRGQESCGIVVNDDGVFSEYKDLGIVNDVFTNERLDALGEGSIAVGHTRYGTTGQTDRNNAQPIVVNHIKGGMALAHNGNIVNSFELRQALELQGSIFQTTSDTEVIAYLITKERLTSESIQEAINSAMNKIRGAYSLVIMSPAKLIAVRDPHGIRPLCYGVTEDGTYVVASESCALDAVSAKFVRDVDPGEILVFSRDGIESIRDHCGSTDRNICIFEYIYFARPDSVIDGVSVHSARVNAGKALAQDWPVDADVVIGVPDSGLDAALGYAYQSGIPYAMGFIKNKYIGRTFIAPGQKQRERMVDIKLNVIKDEVKGKRVVLIDDSVVRGTTSKNIVQKLRDAGAKEVHLRLTAPEFIDACYYGTDIPDSKNLLAANHSLEEMKEIIGCDSLGFLKKERLREMIGEKEARGYCSACFGDGYPAGRPQTNGKYRFERKLSDKDE
ncbi:MAG: amidophosphoribosyltransferase [Eubacteriales bacterium]|jgi:amidophosphoribosyltransferase|uniref:amidophosphoribosyltransferase n=1 Tax=Baileyella intestinalis TaxID=2606709 RepID=UPI0022DF03C6|nr:amidophosphoribosyltransferase [Baileyella intestinalis]MCI7685924.1 amidophosphoribosyltransferase [Clostridiales bacterium]MDD5875416.1 amidophosphoribosyltransferase [Baileyella intestinalis]MDY2994174.1 amidophosphoribosyltransferase [Baileyella intestinalis]